jgi:hypothetical protein
MLINQITNKVLGLDHIVIQSENLVSLILNPSDFVNLRATSQSLPPPTCLLFRLVAPTLLRNIVTLLTEKLQTYAPLECS